MSLSYDGKTLRLSLDAPRNKASTTFSTIMKNIPDAWKDITWAETVTLTPAARSAWLWAAKSSLEMEHVQDVFVNAPADCVRTLARLAMSSVESYRKHLNKDDDGDIGLWKWEETAAACPNMALMTAHVLTHLPLTRLVTIWKYVQGRYYCFQQFARLVPATAIPVLIPFIPTEFQRFHQNTNYISSQERLAMWTRWILTERLLDPKVEKNRFSIQLPKLK